MQTRPVILERRTRATDRLRRLGEGLSDLPAAQAPEGFSIYVTGSYGRLEASPHSDLDLFFIQSDDATPISQIQKTLLDADLIRLVDAQGFPPFSGDGRYLEVHQLTRMLDVLGSPVDDFENLFTARMLLLLESRPVTGKEPYAEVLSRIIASYYRDYHDHETDFLPIFLVNDIIRFWKTLCLNYEHRRNRSEARRKPNVHVKNFKLKFSRLLTCFSGVVALCGQSGKLRPEEVADVVRQSPTERLERVATGSERARALVGSILDEYSWFLDKTGRSTEEVIDWLSDRDERNAAFTRGREFGGLVHELVTDVSGKNGLTRYLLV